MRLLIAVSLSVGMALGHIKFSLAIFESPFQFPLIWFIWVVQTLVITIISGWAILSGLPQRKKYV